MLDDLPLSDADEHRIAIARTNRTLIVSGLYRWALGCLFLLAAFSEFRDHRVSIALGYLVFNQAIGAIVELDAQARAFLALRLDFGERVTRHTILIAARRVAAQEPLDYDFWPEVHRVAKEEFGETGKDGFWKSTGIGLASLAGLAVGDLIGIGIVYALTS